MIRWLIGSCMICLGLTGLLLSPDAAEAYTQSTSRVTASHLAADAKPTSSTPVNINTATAQELDGLPGIGAKMAQRIVDYRQKNGPFKKLEDLMGVQGIGEKNFLKLKPLITITPPKSEHAGT